jgi:Tol biopolymer transport system component
MDTDQWDRLSEWHAAWLAADAPARARLLGELTATQPDLVAHADELMGGDPPAGFLNTPALVLSAEALAAEMTPLVKGTQVGPYRIAGLIARGGMAVVYRATDVRLGRDVAVKTIAPLGVPDDQRVERFVREARITASIDHPNVVRVYDVGVFDGQPYLVTELLEGETLRGRLDRGDIAVADACRIAADVARGLVAAHDAGLVHRDLKPENIFLTGTGATKILDFGIAKLIPEPAGRTARVSTATGVLLGTAGYLAPEQIRGEALDGRADLFALGATLYEMLTGERAFACEHTVDTLHAILHDPAPDPGPLRSGIPAPLSAIVQRLLEKAQTDRFQSAADLAWALGCVDAGAAVRGGTEPRVRFPQPRQRWWIAAGLLPLGVLLGALWAGGPAAPGAPTAIPLARFAWSLPDPSFLGSAPAISPDGRRVCWVGTTEAGVGALYVRDLSSLDARLVRGTDGAAHPFWSPDGSAIGFFADGKLKKISIDGGTPVVLAEAPAGRGGAWSPTGSIVFAPAYRDLPLMRVAERGGPVEPVTLIDRDGGEITHAWPSFLADGVHFVYFVRSMRDEHRGIYLARADSSPAPGRFLFPSDSSAVYVSIAGQPLGALLTVGNDRVEARTFDPAGLAIAGDARAIDIDAAGTSPHHAALLGAAPGVLVHGSTAIPWGTLFASVDRDGGNLRVTDMPELGGFPRVSPDGRRVARALVDPLRGNPDIWVTDLDRGTELRLTTSGDFDVVPVWSPDGREVAYRSGTLQTPIVGFAAADGAGVTRTMPCPRVPCEPSDWSPDGRALIVTVGGRDVWLLPLDGSGPPRPLLGESFVERDARLSPDGRWLAYVSDESGRPEVSVRRFIGLPRRFVISSGGGDQPVWRHDGAELFYVAPPGRLHSVSIRSGKAGTLVFGLAEPLTVPALGERHWGTVYDVSRDGRRIFFPHAPDARLPRQIGLIVGWTALLK